MAGKGAIEIKQIDGNSRRAIKRFVEYGIGLYEGNPYYVPPLVMDDVNTLMASRNPSFDHCEAQCFMAYRDGRPVGRIAGIINRLVNERTTKQTVRFGFLEFEDDAEVFDALIEAVEQWGRERGMNEIVGPMGFTDMDHEGMLTFGFDELGTMATIYNPSYYVEHIERHGMAKDAGWVEYRLEVPDRVPEKIARVADIVRRRYKLATPRFKSRKELKEKYGHALFDLINEAYDGLYGYSPLSEREIDHYIDQYLGILRLDNVCVIIEEESERLIGVGISIPSFTRALQRSRGRIFPTGWYHLLRALTGHTDTVDLLLVAVDPEYQSKGVNALLFSELIPAFIRDGYKWAETNLELEDNASVQNQWQYFERRQHRRRAVFRKDI